MGTDALLIVNDSRFFCSVLRSSIHRVLPDCPVFLAETMADALRVIEQQATQLWMALLDTTLPDALDGEIISAVADIGLPSIVLTSRFDVRQRNHFINQGVIDYVIKGMPGSIDYIADLVYSLYQNRGVEVLVVDDSVSLRQHLGRILESHRLTIHEAGDGREGLEILRRHPGIQLVITDQEMPRMNGMAMVSALRKEFPDRRLSVIGLSDRDDDTIAARFLKHGADDFLVKPFRHEEFQYRMKRHLTLNGLIQQLEFKNTQLSKAYRTLEEDLQAAAQLQKSYLPAQEARIGSVQYGSFFRPSTFLSGDMFNFFAVTERVQAFYVLDVAGHGVAAALMAASLANLLRVEFLTPYADLLDAGDLETPVAATLQELNRRFEMDTEVARYFTIVLGLLEAESGRLSFCQAGHPSPLRLTVGRSVQELDHGDVPVGFLSDPDYTAMTITLAQRERLFLYSDGITECESPDGEPFGETRLKASILNHHDQPLGASVDALAQTIKHWRGNETFADDLSILALERQ